MADDITISTGVGSTTAVVRTKDEGDGRQAYRMYGRPDPDFRKTAIYRASTGTAAPSTTGVDVTRIQVVAGSLSGTFAINGGTAITLNPGEGYSMRFDDPREKLVAPTITLTGGILKTVVWGVAA